MIKVPEETQEKFPICLPKWSQIQIFVGLQ